MEQGSEADGVVFLEGETEWECHRTTETSVRLYFLFHFLIKQKGKVLQFKLIAS
jgi:hypothetical protein